MTTLPPVGGHGALHLLYDPDSLHDDCSNAAAESSPAPGSSGGNKRKRRPAGTPDPGAEVVALSPKTLMESDRYICEICNQGFQRDQNLQMHRRRHKVPWKLLKKPSLGTHKRVYVCPELSCLHHDPSHALGDLVGIKKHYRRKHCIEKQWKCDRCSKGYAVQSDYKAHLKTCGTRGHCCDCGRVFSRVESFIEHQDTCRAVKNKNNMQEGGSDRKRNRRNLSESPSQSSDTTQAITLAHSGISDTTARSLDSSRLINEPTTEFNTNPVALMPLWLVERRNELQLLPWKRQSPEISYSEAFQASGTMHDIRREVSGARSQVTRCSSITSPCPEVSFSDSKSLPPSLTSDDANTPSLQLSIGPYSTEVASENDPGPCEIDTKPSLSSAEREAVAITYEQRQPRGGEASVTGIGQRGYSGRGLGKDLALSFPGVHGAQPGVDVSGEGKSSLSLNDFLLQAARRLGPPKNENRPSSSQFSQPEQPMSTHVEMASNVTLVGSTSKSHADERERGQDSDSLMMWATRKGSLQQPQAAPEGEPANLNFFRKQARDRTEVAQTELFAASRSIEEAAMQKEIAAAACVEAIQAREQARTDINKAWSDMAAARRTKEQARQESNTAQKELGRADLLKKEAREQLQLASTEKAYADHAREVAKRHMDMAEAELANAKRLREHAQTEMEKAQLLKQRAERSADSQLINATGLCQSCKGPSDRLPSQINQTNRTTHTSSVNAATSWATMTGAPALTFQSSRGESQLHYMSSGSSSLDPTEFGPEIVQDHKRVLSLMMVEAPRIPRTSSWPVSEPGAALPRSPSANSSRWMSLASSSMPIYATSMAVEGTPQQIRLGDQSGSSMAAMGNQFSGRDPASFQLDQLEPLGSPKQLDLN